MSREEPPVVERPIRREKGTQFIVERSELIVDPDTGEKYVTITITPQMLHFIFAGLGKYKEGFTGNNRSDEEERNTANVLIEEFNDVKAILNREAVVRPFGRQEPNPVEDTEGSTEEPNP